MFFKCLQRDASLSKLLNSVKHLYTLYAVSGIESQDSNADLGHLVFLSQNSLAAFHFAEEKFTVELTAFTKKQFFEVLYRTFSVLLCIACNIKSECTWYSGR